MDEQQYEHTGNKIPLTIDELIQCVFDRLEIYDSIAGGGTNTASSYNPYVHPIIYNTRDGKTVQIPEEIHQRAIGEWSVKKKGLQQGQSQYDGPPGFSMDRQSSTVSKDVNYSNREEIAESQEYTQPPVNIQDQEDYPSLHKLIKNKKGEEVVIIRKNNYTLLIATIVGFLLLGFYLHKKGKLKL